MFTLSKNHPRFCTISWKIGEDNLVVNSQNKFNEKKNKGHIDDVQKKVQALKINGKSYKIWVQIASFSNKKSANILKTKFISIKNINIKKTNLKGKFFYRVRVGPFKEINDTKKIYNFLINSGMEGTKIFVE